MATYTEATGFDKGSAGIPAKGLTKVSMIEVTLDWSNISTKRIGHSFTSPSSK